MTVHACSPTAKQGHALQYEYYYPEVKTRLPALSHSKIYSLRMKVNMHFLGVTLASWTITHACKRDEYERKPRSKENVFLFILQKACIDYSVIFLSNPLTS
jgi:hypothetical protein